MARTPFTVEVLTPEGEVFNAEVEMLSTLTSVGSIGILANHQPLLAMLDPTELRLYKSESEVVRYAQGEGFLQMTGDRALETVALLGRGRIDAHRKPVAIGVEGDQRVAGVIGSARVFREKNGAVIRREFDGQIMRPMLA